MKTLRLTFIALFGTFLLYACAAPQAESTEEQTEETAVEESTTEEESMEEEEVSFMLPSPIQIAAIFNRAGLEYESELTNSADNLVNYNTKTSKYLNFGTYSADLAYCVINDQQQPAIKYVQTLRTLSDDIGMSNVFDSGELADRFEKNISNQDSVLSMLTDIKRRTDEYLEENDQDSKAAIFFLGAWVEGMYIGSKSMQNNEHLTARLLEQMTILETLVRALNKQTDASFELDGFIQDLVKLDDTFNGFESVKALENDDVEIEDIQMTEEEVSQISTQIEAIRTQIVNG